MPFVNIGNGNLVEMSESEAAAFWFNNTIPARFASQYAPLTPTAPQPNRTVLSGSGANADCVIPSYGWLDPAPNPPKSPCIITKSLGHPCLPEGWPANDGSYYDGVVKCPDGSPMQSCPNSCPGVGVGFPSAFSGAQTKFLPQPSTLAPIIVAPAVTTPQTARPASPDIAPVTPSVNGGRLHETVAPTVPGWGSSAPTTGVGNGTLPTGPPVGALPAPGAWGDSPSRSAGSGSDPRNPGTAGGGAPPAPAPADNGGKYIGMAIVALLALAVLK